MGGQKITAWATRAQTGEPALLHTPRIQDKIRLDTADVALLGPPEPAWLPIHQGTLTATP